MAGKFSTSSARAEPDGLTLLGIGLRAWPGRALDLPGGARRDLLLDLVAVVLAAVLSRSASLLTDAPAEDPGTLTAFAALVLAILAVAGAYRERATRSFLDELRIIVISAAIAAMAVTFVTLLVSADTMAAKQGLREWLFATACLTVGRGAARITETWRWRHGGGGRATLIVGAGNVGHLIAGRLVANPQLGLRPVGFVDDSPLEAQAGPQIPILGPNSDLERIVAEHRVEHAILSFSAAPHEAVLAAARQLEEMGVTVSLVPRLFEGIPDRTVFERIAGVPVISIYPTDPRGWQLSLKYALDRGLALLAVVVLSPLLLASAAAVLVDLGRPVLFRQRRVGIDGHEFEMLKLRTMRGSPEEGQANADWAAAMIAGAGESKPIAGGGEPALSRVTRIGWFLRRTSLDELPQLFNVLRGDMSLIGPRPEMPAYVDRFEGVVHRYGDRHRVKSGITGWAQVHGLRGRTSLRDRVEWDNYYIENWSPWLDTKILLMTVATPFLQNAE